MADRIDGYAEALFSVARAEGVLAEVEDELFRFARTLEANDELRSTLTDAAIPIERRRGVVEDILGPRASTTTSALVSFVVGAGRAADLRGEVASLAIGAAEVVVSKNLDQSTQVQLIEDYINQVANQR